MHDVSPQQLNLSLADESRLTIVVLLAEHGSLCVCELIHALEAPQPRVSQHLARLRRDHLVVHRRIANRHYYALPRQLPPWTHTVVAGFREGFARQGRLGDLRRRLDAMPDRPPRLGAA
jgi:ArsR family transcriptional regulator, arsenate/arsenite/antimonite-responsive transcriptional repressor